MSPKRRGLVCGRKGEKLSGKGGMRPKDCKGGGRKSVHWRVARKCNNGGLAGSTEGRRGGEGKHKVHRQSMVKSAEEGLRRRVSSRERCETWSETRKLKKKKKRE